MIDNANSGHIAIGYITRSKGIRGDVKVELLSETPQRFSGLDTLVLQKAGSKDRTVKIEYWREEMPGLRMKFLDINTPEDAKAILVKGYLTVPRNQIPELPANTYYIFELVGCKVEDTQGNFQGEIIDVLELPSTDAYVVQNGEYEFMIPALHQFIVQINIPQRRLVVQRIDELLL